MKTSEVSSEMEQIYGRYLLRKIMLIVILIVGVVIAAGISISINGLGIGFFDSYGYVFDHIMGHTYELHSADWRNDYVIWNTYMPRVVLGILVGAGLAICGVAMQALMKNPLADPYTVGISDGACFGAVAAMVAGFSLSTFSSSMGLVTNAFIGGLIPALVIIALSRIVTLSPATLILIGIALSYIFSGLETTMMVSTDADTLKNAYLWQIGTLSSTSWSECLIPLIVTVVCTIFLMFASRNLNLLALGDESASSLGLNVDTFRTITMIMVSITVAGLICYTGIIGFVGLVAPHVVRMIIGGDNKYLIPASLVGGSLFILIADLISRVVIYPEELRVGLIASVIGAPIFLYMILRSKHNYGEDY